MPIAIRDGCLQKGPVDALHLASRIGFDGIEICIGQDTSANLLWQDGGFEQVNAAIAATGVKVSSLSPGYFAACHPVVDDPALRQQGHDLVLDCIRRCGPVGAELILIPMFPKDMADWPESKWQALADGFRPLAAAAADAGVRLCLETTFSADQLQCLCDEVDSPAFQVYYDTGNTAAWGYKCPPEILQLGARIGAVHVKDTGNKHLGDGEVPWRPTMRALRDVDFDGWFVLETPAGDDAALSAARNYGFTRGWSLFITTCGCQYPGG